MPLTTNKTRDLYIAYSLTEDTLVQLDKMVKENEFDKVSWFASLADGSSLYTTAVAELASLPNTKTRAITRIRCHATSTNSNNEVDVTFRNYGATMGTGSITYEVTGEDQAVVYLSTKLEEFLIELRQWYTPIRQTLPGFIINWACLTATLLWLNRKFATVIGIAHHTWYFVIVTVVIGAILEFVVKRMFPVSAFLIGKGKDRYQSIVLVRSIVGGTVVLGVIVNIISDFLTK